MPLKPTECSQIESRLPGRRLARDRPLERVTHVQIQGAPRLWQPRAGAEPIPLEAQILDEPPVEEVLDAGSDDVAPGVDAGAETRQEIAGHGRFAKACVDASLCGSGDALGFRPPDARAVAKRRARPQRRNFRQVGVQHAEGRNRVPRAPRAGGAAGEENILARCCFQIGHLNRLHEPRPPVLRICREAARATTPSQMNETAASGGSCCLRHGTAHGQRKVIAGDRGRCRSPQATGEW